MLLVKMPLLCILTYKICTYNSVVTPLSLIKPKVENWELLFKEDSVRKMPDYIYSDFNQLLVHLITFLFIFIYWVPISYITLWTNIIKIKMLHC